MSARTRGSYYTAPFLSDVIMSIDPVKSRIAGAAVSALALAGIYWLLPPSLVIQSGTLPFALYFVLLCLLLHRYSALAALSLAITAFSLVYVANESKISLTSLPITLMDIRFFLEDPIEARNALEIGDAEMLMIMAPLLLPGLLLAVRARQLVALPVTGHRLRLAGARLIAFCCIVAGFLMFSAAHTRAVHVALGHLERQLWFPQRVRELSRTLGLVGFIAHSYRLERSGSSNPAMATQGTVPPTADINRAVARYVRPNSPSRDKLPNIVLVHVESTFDPDYVFSLSPPAKSDLFARNKYTQALGPLYVNAIGGGSWISEFEVVTGVDSRFFGYIGYYTHASLSPYVRNTFAHFLKRKGYRSTAFYPVGGDFYNARRAFLKYGFDAFLDSSDLGLTASHWTVSDQEIVRAILGKHEKSDGAPFFWFIELLENHGPHPCRNFTAESDFAVRFARKASFAENCRLNEYARVLKSTSRAFDELIAFLEDLEARTGRPFVVLGYGDHQPYSFTGSDPNFTKFRRVLDPRYTYLHLMSSVPGVVTCCDGAVPHVTTVPTLLSAYVASSLDNLYLGANLYALARCGHDPFTASTRAAADTPKGYMMQSDLERFQREVGEPAGAEAPLRRCAVAPALVDAYRQHKVFSAGLLAAPR